MALRDRVRRLLGRRDAPGQESAQPVTKRRTPRPAPKVTPVADQAVVAQEPGSVPANSSAPTPSSAKRSKTSPRPASSTAPTPPAPRSPQSKVARSAKPAPAAARGGGGAPKAPTATPQTKRALTAENRAELMTLLERRRFVRHPPKQRKPDPESVPNDGYRLLDELRDKVGGMLLLTATPMQLHDFELYSMIELVEPGLFRSYHDFATSREEIASINEAVTVLRSQRPRKADIDRCLDLLRSYDAPVQLLEAASVGRDGREVAALWLSRCHRLSEALVRNRKAEIGGFTKRVAHRIEVEPGNSELKLERDVQAYIRHRYANTDRRKRTAVGLVLVAFQKMACSSTRALAGALETRAARLMREALDDEHQLIDDPDMADAALALATLTSPDAVDEAATLTSLARRARRIEDAKLVALDELVDRLLASGESEKVLIFSQFLGSIEMIRERLAAKHRVEVFTGAMSRDEKEKAHEAFRRHVQVLICSEAGGEGRNFQFCHNIVNYDLPWNPMKIEQRIGRVDRVGQTRDVQIFNFAVNGMLDERILNVLEYRIQLFTETVGALDPILESFEDEIGRIALGSEGEADAAFRKLDRELEDEIRESLQLEQLRRDFVLDWRSLQRDAAGKALGRAPRATREDLETFCRAAVGRYGSLGSVESSAEGGLFVKVPGMIRRAGKEIEPDYRGSFDVAEALRDERMHFFAMGHPLVEALLDTTGDPWWSPVTAFESEDWRSDEPALLVDYRIELYGIRNSGKLHSHVVTASDVRPAVSLLPPSDPSLEVELPAWPRSMVRDMAARSKAAAREDALATLAAFKAEHAAIVEAEFERLNRMYESRRFFVDDRIARNEREIDRLKREGTESQKRILPARQGQVAADQKRLAELEQERKERVQAVRAEIPSHRLTLLGAAMIVRPGRLTEMRR